jgi:hypothetical protein
MKWRWELFWLLLSGAFFVCWLVSVIYSFITAVWPARLS